MPPPRPPAKPLKRKGPLQQEASEAVRLDRSRGALLGLAVGEALGTFCDGRNVPAADFPTLCDGPHTDMRGGGRLELRAGQTSWATQMAVCLSTVLKNLRRYDVLEAGKEYARWLPHAFEVPETVKLALEQVVDGRSPEVTGRRVWQEQGQRPADNASLARCAPLGVFYPGAKHRDARQAAALDDSAVTHFSPQCQIACATLTGVIAAAISTPKEKLDKPDVLKACEAELALAASTLGRKEPDWVQQTKDAADWLREDVKAAQDDDPMLYGPELHLFTMPGSVRIALRLAFWELFHAPTFEAGVMDVANRGATSAAHGAIAGALLGAVHGEKAIPERWREPVLEHVPAQGPGPLSNVYHPQFLVMLAGLGPEDRG